MRYTVKPRRHKPEDFVVDPATEYLYGGIPEKLFDIPHAVAAKYRWTGVDYDDLVQTGNAAVVKAYPQWDPNRIKNGTRPEIGPFIYMRVEMEIKRTYRVGKCFLKHPKLDWNDFVSLTYRAKDRHQKVRDDWHPEAREDRSATREEDAEFVRYCLSRLKPRDREMLVLRHAHDMTYEDIGDMYAVTKEAVRQRVRGALAEIAEFLKSGKQGVS